VLRSSPLLDNCLLDELDKELKQRGHRFARYAVEQFLAKRLRLKINREKSAVARPWNRKFLGYSVTSHHKTKLKVSPASVKTQRIFARIVPCASLRSSPKRH
jgi:RNA-directed DNA polymerase